MFWSSAVDLRTLCDVEKWLRLMRSKAMVFLCPDLLATG
jgi:hypothetical protein